MILLLNFIKFQTICKTVGFCSKRDFMEWVKILTTIILSKCQTYTKPMPILTSLLC